MKTKEIAEVCNVSERTVRDWVAKASAKSAELAAKSAEGRGVGADYRLDEVILIIQAGGRETLAELLRENAGRGLPPATVEELHAARLDRLEGALADLVSVVASLVKSGAVPAARAPLALAEPVEIQPREMLKRVVEDWARAHGRDFHGAWANLYREYTDRNRRDLSREARQAGFKAVLDYADQEDLIGGLLALAYYLYGRARAIA